MPVFIQCTGFIRDPVKFCPYIIKGISHIGKQYGLISVEKCHERQGQHIVGPHSHEHLGWFHPVIRRQRIHQHRGIRVRIQTQSLPVHLRRQPGHPGRRGIGTFIGIQFNDIFLSRLFPGHIGGHSPYLLFPAHLFSPSLFILFSLIDFILFITVRIPTSGSC